ncbi:nucleoid-associated protein, YbaB/EbfC family [Leptospira perolatii]|uniref:Nucleoid-associated protein, YbaB/EbfC family n=1 Tax=Leptospira perolatii TaxID=2023191 RepID=A0A2M9ZPI9_9LEPT|nr:YbaB/EbfC family nucleoid-associated protein [Leptospira perolatii]PJZ70632.1 nucleoid-associated protein, YbaB/EbfC family [Leptospira perolatii]PJZ73843.1 nucleoid-associated protein, YbaB/EbfC family [Leptospira perolatii]
MLGGKSIENFKQMNQMRVRMKRLEKELEALSFEGKSKNELVTCIADGRLTIQEVKVEDELLQKNDKKLLQKSIKQAVNLAIEQAQKAAEERMGEFRSLLSKMPG